MHEDRKRYCVVRIDGGAIVDSSSFHDVFCEALGFPGFYGRNLDAWIDCLTCCDDAESGLTSVVVERGGVLLLMIDEAVSMKEKCPDVFEAMIDCAAFVNFRRVENGEPPVIAVSYTS